MASKAGGNLKGFYRQKKAAGGISKKPAASSKSKPSPKNSKTVPSKAASFGSDVTQPPALVSHGSVDLQGDFDEQEEMLRQFDLNMAYGPCLGMTRLDRWERANRLGLHPPEEIGDLLKSGKVLSECLWDGII